MKKILAVLLSLLMLMMSMAVYATETEHVHEGCCCGEETAEPASEIQPRANICSCGTTMVRHIQVNYKSGQISESCTHGAAAGTDVYNVTYSRYYESCSNCNNHIYYTPFVSTKTLVYCPRGV